MKKNRVHKGQIYCCSSFNHTLY